MQCARVCNPSSCKVGADLHSCRGGMGKDVRIGMAPHWTILHRLGPSAASNACSLPRPTRLFPSTESASKVAVSCAACAHTDVQFGVSRPLDRTRARNSAHTHRRMLLSTASVCRRYLRGHGCWLVIVDRHGRGLKGTFQVGLASIQIRKREVRRTDASALGKSTFDNLPGSTHARN